MEFYESERKHLLGYCANTDIRTHFLAYLEDVMDNTPSQVDAPIDLKVLLHTISTPPTDSYSRLVAYSLLTSFLTDMKNHSLDYKEMGYYIVQIKDDIATFVAEPHSDENSMYEIYDNENGFWACIIDELERDTAFAMCEDLKTDFPDIDFCVYANGLPVKN